MTVAVITPAEKTDLVTLESVKTYLQISDDSQDARLGQLITAASGSFTDYLGRPLALQTYRERWTLRGRIPGVNLSNGPVATILSASVDGWHGLARWMNAMLTARMHASWHLHSCRHGKWFSIGLLW
ncbi:phage head-tail connector protein [Acetobacter pomorum]|uniref:phage head-tail connector protein n=1 Tax=Acetobacter pomorum TaxID=65959 RepID=UPI001F07298C|nr:phage head-tail connector protein [Acetobacter pomorum]